MKGFLAYINPVSSGAHPDQGLPKPPTSGGAPDQTLPGDLPKPEHPIWYPLPPGAPVDPSYGIPIEQPDQGLPPTQPGKPTHPIVLPPDAGGGWGPVYIWGGGPGARPPIALPPDSDVDGVNVEWKAAWTPTTGWVSFGVIVPEGAHITPSKRK